MAWPKPLLTQFGIYEDLCATALCTYLRDDELSGRRVHHVLGCLAKESRNKLMRYILFMCGQINHGKINTYLVYFEMFSEDFIKF